MDRETIEERFERNGGGSQSVSEKLQEERKETT